MNPEISVIIRSRNEEEWIKSCLESVSRQDYVTYEVVLVDNESTDSTLEIAKKFDCRIVTLPAKEFSYGKALNLGVKGSKGKFIAFLSAHCIPLNSLWLFHLKKNFSDPEVAGVYGKQEPLRNTHPVDKRDLWNTFGLERKEQTIDPFFHNANSMIRRSVWEKVKFDEEISGQEDRHWAKQVLAHGYKIIYDPDASVHHPHGINQMLDPDRAERVVGVIEKYKLHK